MGATPGLKDRATLPKLFTTAHFQFGFDHAVAGLAAARKAAFHLDPARSTAKFALGDVLHTVRGTFQVKRNGSLQVPYESGE